MRCVQKIKIKVKTYEPAEKEIILSMSKDSSIKDVVKKMKIKQLDDYVIIINGLSVQDLNEKIEDNSRVVILPKMIGG